MFYITMQLYWIKSKCKYSSRKVRKGNIENISLYFFSITEMKAISYCKDHYVVYEINFCWAFYKLAVSIQQTHTAEIPENVNQIGANFWLKLNSKKTEGDFRSNAGFDPKLSSLQLSSELQ